MDYITNSFTAFSGIELVWAKYAVVSVMQGPLHSGRFWGIGAPPNIDIAPYAGNTPSSKKVEIQQLAKSSNWLYLIH